MQTPNKPAWREEPIVAAENAASPWAPAHLDERLPPVHPPPSPWRRWLDHPARALTLLTVALVLLAGLAWLIPLPAGNVTTRSLLGMGYRQGATPTPAIVIFDPAHPQAPPRIEPFGDSAQEGLGEGVGHEPEHEAYQAELVRSSTLVGWLAPVVGRVETTRVVLPLTGMNDEHLARIPALYTRWLEQRPGEPSWSVRMPTARDYAESWWINPPAAIMHVVAAAAPLVLLRSLWVWSMARRRAGRIQRGECVRCRYDLRELAHAGAGITCPECGAPNEIGAGASSPRA